MWPTKSSKNNFFAAHAIVNRQHDDVQNERSLGTNLSQLNENENGREKKGGQTLLKNFYTLFQVIFAVVFGLLVLGSLHRDRSHSRA